MFATPFPYHEIKLSCHKFKCKKASGVDDVSVDHVNFGGEMCL